MAAHDWFVVTGAASGIMEAGHAGAGREHSMGLNILLPFEQSTNPIIAGDRKLVYMKYFFTRKLMFVKESDAFCLMPGGFGTLDEGLEVLTLLQTGKHDMMPVVLLDEPGGSYWTAFDQFVRRPVARSRHDRRRRPVALPADRPGRGGGRGDSAILPRLPQHALRSHQPGVSASAAAERVAARRDQRPFPRHPARRAVSPSSGPLPEERDESDLAALPRLVFHFDRRSFGRLRQLIDCINRGRGQGLGIRD